jgi:hypothetical protein
MNLEEINKKTNANFDQCRKLLKELTSKLTPEQREKLNGVDKAIDTLEKKIKR